MGWLLGTFIGRFNRRHRLSGHHFGGRYKTQHIDGRSGAYLVTACDYVHLNPARAGLVRAEEPLETWRWSSYPGYLRPRLRTPWLRVDRVLGEHGLQADGAGDRREYARRVEALRQDGNGEAPEMKRGWRLGAEDFVERLGRAGASGERAAERHETDEQLALRIVRAALAEAGIAEAEWPAMPKGDPRKVAIASRLRAETPMTRMWIAARLAMGSASYLSALLKSRVDDSKL